MGIITKNLVSLNIEELTNDFNKELPKREDCQIYPNQLECARNALISFDSAFPRPNHIIIKGKTQAGKTGVLTAMIMLIAKMNLEGQMKINDIYYITGDNSCRLLKQTYERISSVFNSDSKCTFHCLKNSDLKKECKTYVKNEITNAIVFVDESHYGTTDNKNSVIEWLEHNSINMKNTHSLTDKYVYIISNSATPYDEINNDKADVKRIVTLKTNDWDGIKGYVGFKEYKEHNCILTTKTNINQANVNDYCTEFTSYLSYLKEKTGKRKCVIMRMSQKNYKKCKDTLNNYFEVRTYFAVGERINYEAIQTEIEHHFDSYDKPLMIIVAGAYRMGVSIPTYCKNNIGIVYDFATGNGITAKTTEQGLLGRVTGYWETNDWYDINIYINEKHSVSLSKCYVEKETSTPQVKTYIKFVEDENGDNVDVITENDDYVEYKIEEVYDENTYKKEIDVFLRRKDRIYENLVQIPGRRNMRNKFKSVHKTPSFNVKDTTGGVIIKASENLNKKCYTFLYDYDEGVLRVIFGTIRKGKYIEYCEEIKKEVETLITKEL